MDNKNLILKSKQKINYSSKSFHKKKYNFINKIQKVNRIAFVLKNNIAIKKKISLKKIIIIDLN